MHSHIVRRSGVCLVVLTLVGGSLVAADILAQLGLSAAAAKEQLMSYVGSGWLDYGLAAPAFKKAPVALRVQLAEGAIAYAKSYTASAEFKTAYAKLRDTRKPEEPKFEGTPEQEYAKQREEQAKEAAKGAEDMKKAMAQMDPAMRKQMEEAMAQAAAIQKQMDTPDMKKMMLDGIRMQREGKASDYQAALAKWKTEYPEDPGPVLATKLRHFLDISANVDFDAKTELKDGKMRFVNPIYESKPSEWKLCYRVGREPVTAARAAVQAWLKELGR